MCVCAHHVGVKDIMIGDSTRDGGIGLLEDAEEDSLRGPAFVWWRYSNGTCRQHCYCKVEQR